MFPALAFCANAAPAPITSSAVARAIVSCCPRDALWLGGELRNVTCLDLEELQMQLDPAIGRLRQKLDIVRSFFAGAGATVMKLQTFAQRSVDSAGT